MIASVELLSDTGTDEDGSTDSPRLFVTVSGVEDLVNLPVEVDLDGDGESDALFSTDDAGSGEVIVDLRGLLATGGPQTVDLRAGKLQSDGTFEYGEWTRFEFIFEAAGQVPLPTITGLHLVNDTGSPTI